MKKNRPALGLLLIITFSISLATAGEVPIIKSTDEQPVIAVWWENMGRSSINDPGPFVVLAIWGDGKVVWSKDNIEGGPPYYEGKIDPKVLKKTLHEFEVRKIFSTPIRKNYFGPDSSYTTLYVSKGKKKFVSKSWHELFEKNPKLVAGSHGITSLNGVTREEYLKNDTKEYQQYRALWSDIREKIDKILPKSGKEKKVSFELQGYRAKAAQLHPSEM